MKKPQIFAYLEYGDIDEYDDDERNVKRQDGGTDDKVRIVKFTSFVLSSSGCLIETKKDGKSNNGSHKPNRDDGDND